MNSQALMNEPDIIRSEVKDKIETKSVEVRPVLTQKELMDFIKFPWKIYKKDKAWVPPLITEKKSFFNKKKNPFFKHADIQPFIAYRKNKPVGTICATINYNYLQIHKDDTGFFGFYESIDDQEVTNALFDAARKWLAIRRMNRVIGPMNLSIHHPCGLLVDGFDQTPTFLMTYNPDYYQDRVEIYGFKKTTDLFAYKLHKLPESIVKSSNEIIEQTPELEIRKMEIERFESEKNHLKELYNNSMIKNWGYVPFTDEEFEFATKDLKSLVDPDIAYFALYDGKIVGYNIFIPDYNPAFKKMNGRIFPFGIIRYLLNKKKISTARAWALAVHEDYRIKRVSHPLYHYAIESSFKKGFETVEASWINEKNAPMNNALKMMGFELYRTYRIYEMRTERSDEL